MIKLLLHVVCNCFNLDGQNTLGIQDIVWTEKRSFCMYKIIVIFSGWNVKNGDLNFLSLKISYIGGLQEFEPLFKSVLIGLGVSYFDEMRTTVNCAIKKSFSANIEIKRFWHDSNVMLLHKIIDKIRHTPF